MRTLIFLFAVLFICGCGGGNGNWHNESAHDNETLRIAVVVPAVIPTAESATFGLDMEYKVNGVDVPVDNLTYSWFVTPSCGSFYNENVKEPVFFCRCGRI